MDEPSEVIQTRLALGQEEKDAREMTFLNGLLMALLNILRADSAIRWVIAGFMVAAGFTGINYMQVSLEKRELAAFLWIIPLVEIGINIVWFRVTWRNRVRLHFWSEKLIETETRQYELTPWVQVEVFRSGGYQELESARLRTHVFLLGLIAASFLVWAVAFLWYMPEMLRSDNKKILFFVAVTVPLVVTFFIIWRLRRYIEHKFQQPLGR